MNNPEFMRNLPTVFYLVPDYDQPSWGIGLLYRHVELLQQNRIRAAIVHQNAPFRLSWLESNVPLLYLDDPALRPQSQDIVVLPEVLAAENDLRQMPGRRMVFVQNTVSILMSSKEAVDYQALGYEHAMATMPHIQEIIERHFGIPATLIPPFIAPYFFCSPNRRGRKPRAKQIALFPKFAYQQAGYPDYDIMLKLLRRKIAKEGRQWDIVELQGWSHLETAQIMRESIFFVSVNSFEGFNATVPEAMAAGCIPICYEAYGGRDFLQDGVNAFVFPNNYVYPLIDKLFDLMDHYDQHQQALSQIQSNAYVTACQYTEERTERALLTLYHSLAYSKGSRTAEGH